MGIVHGELTTLLWGGAFGFVWTYVVAARLAAGWARAVRAPRASLTGLPGPQLELRAENPPAAPAFFHWAWRIEGEHSPERRFHRTVAISSQVLLPLELPRGRYRIHARWELADAFGLTRFTPRTRWESVITVEPKARPFSPPPPPPTRPGPWRPLRSGRRAGDPFDVRAYAPGDDLRRLHWPLYAHSGSPFVRTAEPSPPPTGHQFLVLDTEAPSEEVLDVRLGALTSWLGSLDAEGTGWTLSIPAADLTLGAGSEVASTLAALVPAALPDRPVDVRWPELVTVLTGTVSSGAERLGRRLVASRRRFRPVVVEAPPAAQRAPAPWWSRR